MHDLTYLGDGRYQCKDCGEITDKAGHAAFQETACSGKDDFVTINKKLARLDKEMKEVETLYQENAERMANLENRLQGLETAEPPVK